MLKRLLRTLLSVIGLGIVIGNPITNHNEKNVSSNRMNTYAVEKEIVSLRTISLDDTSNTSSKENSKKATIKIDVWK